MAGSGGKGIGRPFRRHDGGMSAEPGHRKREMVIAGGGEGGARHVSVSMEAGVEAVAASARSVVVLIVHAAAPSLAASSAMTMSTVSAIRIAATCHGFAFGVYSSVARQLIAPAKPLPAPVHGTGKGFLSGVRANVSRQMLVANERLVAPQHGARKLSLLALGGRGPVGRTGRGQFSI
jgi:hypothetical protein